MPWSDSRRPRPTPIEPADELAQLRAKNQKLRNEKAALTAQLRDTNRDKIKTETALAAMQARLDRERRHNEATCAHAKQAADVRRLAVLFQDRYLEQRRINERYTESDLKPVPPGPEPEPVPAVAVRAARIPRPRSRQ